MEVTPDWSKVENKLVPTGHSLHGPLNFDTLSDVSRITTEYGADVAETGSLHLDLATDGFAT